MGLGIGVDRALAIPVMLYFLKKKRIGANVARLKFD